MPAYENALQAMRHLLTEVGEQTWLEWIEHDLRAWQTSRSVEHHLSAYGGMGSFSDLVLCEPNGHRLTGLQEPWANALFQDLKSVCCALAQNGGQDLPASDISLSMGTSGEVLEGWRCLECGYGEVTPVLIEWYLAKSRVRSWLVEVLEASTIVESTTDLLGGNLPGIGEVRSAITLSVQSSRITVRGREGRMRPCPECGNEKTAVYRWEKVGDSFAPSADNLPVEGGTV